MDRFVAWLRQGGFSGYDQYDLWAARLGLWAKRQYYRGSWTAKPFVVTLLIADWLAPSLSRRLCVRRRFPIADAHYLMGFLELFRARGDADHARAAVSLAEDLLGSSLSGYSGYCWGYPFDWQTKRGLWLNDTPLVTTTPYVFDAFVELWKVCGGERDITVARGIARFVAEDIRHHPVGRGAAASYTPNDASQILNASAYSAACLAEAGSLFDIAAYTALARSNARFVVDHQQPDGSWLYSANDPSDAFIDHFHTCFVLKGIYRAYRVLGDPELLHAVRRGVAYYLRNLFGPDGRPKPFSKVTFGQFRELELYDYAEAINLCLLLSPDFQLDHVAERLAAELIGSWQTEGGWFATRMSTGGIWNRVPYHRWAQAQTFRALAAYYRYTGRETCAA